jgi:hypothetical protein
VDAQGRPHRSVLPLGEPAQVHMSSMRKLWDKMAWPDDIRAIELLNWESRPEEFNRLCDFIIEKFAERDGISRDRLFSFVPEDEFRRQVRASAELFTERQRSLVMFIYMRMKFLVMPSAGRQERDGTQ